MQRRTILLFLFTCYFVVHVFGNQQPENLKVELPHVQEMQQALDEKGLWDFLNLAKEQRWSMPKIRSDYWVDQLPEEPKERVQLELAKRAFGLAISKMLDQEALALLEPANSTTRAAQADDLLTAANWLGGSHGYGNLLLFSRTENLACIPIGHLVADMGVDTKQIDAFMARLSTPEADLSFRIDVLNEEAPQPLNINFQNNVKRSNDELDLFWNRGYHVTREWCKENDVPRPKNKQTRKDIPPEYAFFADDQNVQHPYTVTHKWDQKQHRTYCIYGNVKNIRTAIDKLYLFRENIGGFSPPVPPWFGPEEKIYTETEAAFTEVWMPFMNEFGPIGQFVAQSYKAIQTDHFMDWDTSQLVEFLEKETNAKGGIETH